MKISKSRERLIYASTTLFAKYGYNKTTVDMIAQKAGLTKGALYYYFESKEDLLAEVYVRVLRMQRRRLEDIKKKKESAKSRLLLAVVDVAKTSIENIEQTRIFWRSMHMLSAHKQAEVRLKRREYHESFRELLEEALSEEGWSLNTPSDIVINYYFGAIHHVTMWFNSKGAWSSDDVAKFYGVLFMDMIKNNIIQNRTKDNQYV